MPVKDDNDRAKDGTLPAHPGAGARPALPAPAVRSSAIELAASDGQIYRAAGDPHAEAALLGALLWAGTNAPLTLTVNAVKDVVGDASMFAVSCHQPIFQAILDLDARGVAPDAVTVNTELVRVRAERAAGGIQYLDELVSGAATFSETRIREHAKVIRDLWVRRQTVNACRALAGQAMTMSEPIETIVSAAGEMAVSIAQVSGGDDAIIHQSAAIAKVIRRATQPQAPAIRTGFAALDLVIGGLFPKEHTILAAATSVGKTVFAQQIAEGVVRFTPNAAALYCGLESPHEQLATRALSRRARVDAGLIRRGKVFGLDLARTIEAAKELNAEAISYLDSQSQSISTIEAAAAGHIQKLAREGKRLALIVIDHVHLLRPEKCDATKPRHEQVASMSRGFIRLSEQYGCHVLALAHVKREAELRKGDDKIPKLHDIRESSAVANNANQVFIMHRNRDARGKFVADEPMLLFGAKTRDGAFFELAFDVEPQHVAFRERLAEPQHETRYAE